MRVSEDQTKITYIDDDIIRTIVEKDGMKSTVDFIITKANPDVEEDTVSTLFRIKLEKATDKEVLMKRIEKLEERVAELEGSQEQPKDTELSLKIDGKLLAKQVIRSINELQKKQGSITLQL